MTTRVAADAVEEVIQSSQCGSDIQGFPIKQGALTHSTVHLLLNEGCSCCRPRRTRERTLKSIRECTVHANLSIQFGHCFKKKEKDITGLTDSTMLCQLGPKELAESENFSGPLKMMISASILSESSPPPPKRRR